MDRSWYTCYGKCILNAYQLTGESLLPESGTSSGRCSYLGTAFKWGWPYMLDFSEKLCLSNGIPKLQKGYIHCAQEHAHYYGNCTYDDAATYDSGMFLLYVFTDSGSKYKYPVERCLDFVLESQYPIGGWPQLSSPL